MQIILTSVFFYAAYKNLIAALYFSSEGNPETPDVIPEPSLVEKLNSSLDRVFTVSWKPVLGVLLAILIIYVCINTYKWLKTYYETKNSKDPEIAATAKPLELGGFVALRSITIPVIVLYWSLFVGLLWTRLTLLPAAAVLQGDMSQAKMLFAAVFAATFIGVYIGVALTRLMYNYARKAWPFTDEN